MASMRTSRSLAPLAGPDEAPALHHLDDARGAVVAEAELALEPRGRAAARVGDEADGVVVQRVLLGVRLVVRGLVVVARLEDVLVVDRLALRAEEVGHALDLLLAHPRALHALGLVRCR